ncbi:hypothetical protein [Idiomarina xiamenensis]|uniref:hypothetical protein n=1 Tax=Idiomarina xiamenensis TaxID=1207041 RepID=UPI0003089D8A|nr:hypothetical protein [Idiomarina xiamenensis]
MISSLVLAALLQANTVATAPVATSIDKPAVTISETKQSAQPEQLSARKPGKIRI